MLEIDKTIWVSLAHGVESVAGTGAAVWREPPAVRKALGELAGVLPMTHAQIDLDAMLGAVEGGWRSMLEGTSEDLMRETALAINDAFRPPRLWGVGLPCPGAVGGLLGDASERGALKTGLQMAGRLRLFRDAGASFVTIDLIGAEFAGQERALAPILRNAEMYGWKRALCVAGVADASELVNRADAVLTAHAEVGELDAGWLKGSAIGGGLTERIWKGEPLARRSAPRFLLFGRIPAATPARAIVDTGRMISSWSA